MNKHRETLPLGVLLGRTARMAERAFESGFEGSGGSRSWWGILRALSDGQAETQAALALQLGLTGATMVHHLDAMQTEGLIERGRNSENRRVQTVALTAAGQALYQRLLVRVQAFDAALRRMLSDDAEAALRAGLLQIEAALAKPERAND